MQWCSLVKRYMAATVQRPSNGRISPSIVEFCRMRNSSCATMDVVVESSAVCGISLKRHLLLYIPEHRVC